MAAGVKSEPTEPKNEEICETPGSVTNGRVSCLSSNTGLGVFVIRGGTALAVEAARLSTLTAFCRIVEVLSCILLDLIVFEAVGMKEECDLQ